MGCGFSSEESKASDEERILKSTADCKNEEQTNSNSMGAALSKKSPSRKEKNKETNGISNNSLQGNNGTISTKAGLPSSTNGKLKSSSSPLNIQSTTSEVSSSQVNFFKMLDEKIENGFEPEEQDTEQEVHLRLQRVAEEWDTLLGRSQDSNDLNQQPQKMMTSSSSDLDVQETLSGAGTRSNHPQDLSNDSMRTMFSNSANLPPGSLKEAAATGSTSNATKSASITSSSTTSAVASSSVSARSRQVADTPE